MINLITIEQAKLHLQIEDDDTSHDADIAMKVEQASAITMEFCKLAEPPDAWVDADTSPVQYTVPAYYQTLTLLALSELNENRDSSTTDVISKAFMSLLIPKRDPTMA